LRQIAPELKIDATVVELSPRDGAGSVGVIVFSSESEHRQVAGLTSIVPYLKPVKFFAS
jgi:hypothetical protein